MQSAENDPGDRGRGSGAAGCQGSAVETGQYDDHSHVYCFEDEGSTWTYVGQIITESESKRSWMVQVSPHGRLAYALGGADEQDESAELYEFDLTTRSSRKLCRVNELLCSVVAVAASRRIHP